MYDDMLMFNLTDIYLTLTHQTPGYRMDQETAGNIGLQGNVHPGYSTPGKGHPKEINTCTMKVKIATISRPITKPLRKISIC